MIRCGFTVAAVATAIFGAAGASAADDPLLKRLVGKWEGMGVFRWDAASQPERVYCQITASLSPEGMLHQGGRCAVTSRSAVVSIDIGSPKAGTYSGVATGSLFGFGVISPQPASFSGTGKGNQMVLIAPPNEGQAGPTVTTIDLLQGGFRVRAERIDPQTRAKFIGADVTFGPGV